MQPKKLKYLGAMLHDNLLAAICSQARSAIQFPWCRLAVDPVAEIRKAVHVSFCVSAKMISTGGINAHRYI